MMQVNARNKHASFGDKLVAHMKARLQAQFQERWLELQTNASMQTPILSLSSLMETEVRAMQSALSTLFLDAHVKLFIADLLALPYDNNSKAYRLYSHAINNVEILGNIVAKCTHFNRITYTVDDGSGLISCVLWKTQKAYNDSHAEFELGDEILVQGQIHTWKNERRVNIHNIRILSACRRDYYLLCECFVVLWLCMCVARAVSEVVSACGDGVLRGGVCSARLKLWCVRVVCTTLRVATFLTPLPPPSFLLFLFSSFISFLCVLP